MGLHQTDGFSGNIEERCTLLHQSGRSGGNHEGIRHFSTKTAVLVETMRGSRHFSTKRAVLVETMREIRHFSTKRAVPVETSVRMVGVSTKRDDWMKKGDN